MDTLLPHVVDNSHTYFSPSPSIIGAPEYDQERVDGDEEVSNDPAAEHF